MTLSVEALQHIEAQQSTNNFNDAMYENEIPLIALPKNVATKDIQEYMPYPMHFKGNYSTRIINEFTAYCNEHKAAVVFVDDVNMTAKATFDFGEPSNPKHRFHTAKIELYKSLDFTKVLNLNGQRLSQKQIAEFIEEYHANIATLGKEETISGSAPSIDLNKSINAIRKINIKAKAESGSRIDDLSESQSVFSSIDVDNTEGNIPAYIDFKCTPYQGLKLPTAINSLLPGEEIEREDIQHNEERVFRFRISVITGGEKPMFALKLLKISEHEEYMANAFKLQLGSELDSATTVRIGTFK